MTKSLGGTAVRNPVDVLEEELKGDGIPLLVDLHTVAKLACRSYSFCWRACAGRSLKTFKLGRHILVKRRDLAEWMLSGNTSRG